ncbi:unnamed protein product [Lactuca saligna]|uniref:Uncharacterized protein n=1 Tax=Lactuca saligna TaxID=75948 RepID=A0AA36DXJ3_LACSI|nr:unnamed protein product [Lactuca saligna]
MTRADRGHAFVGSSLPSTFSPEVIQSALNELTPNNVRIFWESTNFDGHTELTEPWYGTAFSVEKITGSTIQMDHGIGHDELEVLSVLEPEHLSRFYPEILSIIFIECYAAAIQQPENIESNEAEFMIQQVEDVLFMGTKPLSQALFPSQHLTNRVVNLEKGVIYCYTKEGLNPSDENSALLHYIQDDFKLNIKLQLVSLIAKQPAFHQLRSVEQPGYITVLMQRNDSRICGVQFVIQSTVKGPKHIESSETGGCIEAVEQGRNDPIF